MRNQLVCVVLFSDRQPVALIEGFLFFLVFNSSLPLLHSLPTSTKGEAAKGHDALLSLPFLIYYFFCFHI